MKDEVMGHVAWIGKIKDSYRIVVRKYEDRRPLRRCRHG
jgi:hypothetical protein